LTEKILLGFEVPSGDPVYIAPQHLAIFGMTQLSGKTTTLEALITRSGLKGIAFITKRGESGFIKFERIPPFYKERVDWRYVESLLNTALGEKVKYEPRMRYAIMNVSRGSKTLREVQQKAIQKRDKSKREWDKEVYDKLVAYLELVLPELERHTFATKVELQDGINVMDLSDMKLETQQLIIGSTIGYIHEHYQDVVVIIPEAWENIPQSRMTPVKWIVEQFVRKGASIGNYLWIDSQDIGGIDKTPLRQVSTWIMGKMMEAHEVERIIKQLLGIKIPAKDIQTLPLGHFYVTVGDEIKKVYVLPSEVPDALGVSIAMGSMEPKKVKELLKRQREKSNILERIVIDPERIEMIEKQMEILQRDVHDAHVKIDALLQKGGELPSGINVQQEHISLNVKVIRQSLQLNQESIAGRIALVYAESLLPDTWFATGILRKIMENRFAIKDAFANLKRELDNFIYYGYFERRMSGIRPEYRVKMSPEQAKEKGLLKFEG